MLMKYENLLQKLKKKTFANIRVYEIYKKRATKYYETNERCRLNLKTFEPKLSKMSSQINEDVKDHAEGEKMLSEQKRKLEQKSKREENRCDQIKRLEDRMNKIMDKQDVDYKEYQIKKESLQRHKSILEEVKQEKDSYESKLMLLMTSAGVTTTQELIEKSKCYQYNEIYRLSSTISEHKLQLQLMKSELSSRVNYHTTGAKYDQLLLKLESLRKQNAFYVISLLGELLKRKEQKCNGC